MEETSCGKSEELYGVIKLTWGMNEKPDHALSLKIFRMMVENNRFELMSLCRPTSKTKAQEEAAKLKRDERMHARLSKSSCSFRYMVKKIEKVKGGWRMTVSNRMLKRAIDDVIGHHPELRSKV